LDGKHALLPEGWEGRTGGLIEEAEATLEEASGIIANGYLRLDREEWSAASSSGVPLSAGSGWIVLSQR
jgi:hypothetical protein